MDPWGAETALSLAFPLPLCPDGVKAGGLPQYLPLGWVDKGGGLPANLRLMANKWRGSQESSNLCGCCKKTSISIPDCMMVRSCELKRKWASNSWLHDCRKREPELKTMWLLPLQNVQFLTAWLSEAWIWKKIEHPLPDCMIVRNLILTWKLNTNFPTACLSGTWF